MFYYMKLTRRLLDIAFLATSYGGLFTQLPRLTEPGTDILHRAKV